MAVLMLLESSARCEADALYHFLKEIPVAGDQGWGTLTIDEAARRLYITRDTKIDLVDLAKDKVVGEITNTPGVHGFALAPKFGFGFSSNGKESKVGMVNLKSLKTQAKIKAGEEPDSILLNPNRMDVYVFNAGSRSATVYEADDGDPVATIPLPGRPGSAVVDSKTGMIFCALSGTNEIAVIDGSKRKVINHWPIAPGEGRVSMAINSENQQLFVGGANGSLQIMSITNGSVIASLPVKESIDSLAYDPETRFLFASSSVGKVLIWQGDISGNFTLAQELKTQPGARAMALGSTNHAIYLATASPQLSKEQPIDLTLRNSRIVPDSLKVLVYAINLP